ncbi:MAG: sulfotransferase [Nocardioidaceae bacterium]|nr:sulfotransferase [Nocardioidaceae bacterium]
MTTGTVPNFLVAGAARCGTTGLVEGLRAHPQVFVTQPKEPHYFALHGRGADFEGPGDSGTINRVAVTNRADYLALYPQEHCYLALGDGSVSTLYYFEESLPEILRLNPEMRLIILLRDPVERAYSSHQYMRARGFEPHEDFLAAVREEPRRRAENWHHIWHYTQMSLYAESIAAVQAALPPEQIGIWFYDDLDRDYDETLQQILRFLDVPLIEGQTGSIPRVNISGQPRFAPLHSGISWATRNDSLRRAVKRSTTYRFRERIRRYTLQREGITEEARVILTPLFSEDLRLLRSLLSGDVPRWLQPGGERH